MRNGKIAKLPDTMREELNLRMENGEEGPKLLEWLNGLPEAQERLKESFGGVPISKQNLCEWRQGGFREWQIRRELVDHACQLSESASDLEDVVDTPFLGGDLVAILAARYAALLNTWDGEADPEFEEKLRLMRGLAQDIALIQRTMQRATNHKTEFEQQLENRHRREIEEMKEKTLAPFWAMLNRNSIEAAFGGSEAGKKVADIMTAIEYDLPWPKDAKGDQPDQPSQTQSNPVKPEKT